MQSIRPPDKFNMVDMEGIDILAVHGETIPGLYDKLVESIALCRYQCVYNWSFNSILIPPTYVEMEEREDGVWINEGVMVDEEDVVHIANIAPVIESLSVTENGTYLVPEGVDGFNPVTVDVPAESGKILLADYTASENVSEIVISGDDFDDYRMFLLELTGNLSTTEWIYPGVNGAYGGNYWPPNTGTSVFSYKVTMTRKPTGIPERWQAQDRLYIPASSANGVLSSYAANINNGFQSMQFKLYGISSTFLTGFNVKLWGISI